jgi:hypothetical protein
LLLIKRKDFSDILFFIIIKKFNLTEKKFETHQNIFKKLDSYLSLKFILQEYEKAKFYDKHMSFVKFIRNSYKILRCKKI